MIREFLAQYGGFAAAGKRSAELNVSPKQKLTEGVSIDDYSTWRATRFAARRKPDEREAQIGEFSMCHLRTSMLSATRSEGGCYKVLAKGVTKPYSFICLIPLLLSTMLIGLTRADPAKSGRTIATPLKTGGSCGPGSGTVEHAAIAAPCGVAIVLIDPCGKARSSPQRGR